ncbi:MAG: CbiX/SirB N-terminal domain-containing protein [Caldimonas sp.]
MKAGLLLFAHGARDPRWAEPFEDVAARVRRSAPDLAVELAYLEFMAPTLVEAGDRLAATGCDEVDVVPLFLGAGGHVRKDLPVLLDKLRAQHSQVQWRLRAAIGEVDTVIEAMAQAALRLCTSAQRAPR